MTEQTALVAETETATKPKIKKAKDKQPCLCSRLLAMSEVVQPEAGGTGEADEELTTGCPGVLTSKTFAPGHDAKAVGFLLDMVKRPDLELRFGSSSSDPETVAKQLGDALYLKFLTGRDNLAKAQTAKAEREAAKATKKAAAEAEKAAKKAQPEPESDNQE
jgi:hypothetical protein